MPGQANILLFGPQETKWSEKDLLALQSELRGNDRLKFLRDAVEELRSLEPFLKQHLHGVSSNDVPLKALHQLSDFAAGGAELKTGLDSMRNTHQAPLTVIQHIMEYISLASTCGQALDLTTIDDAQGFCIGFLSATAVATSNTWRDLEQNTVCALRLAACIGAIVDVENAAGLGAAAISTKWKTETQHAFVEASILNFPDTYISCLTDDKAVTITVSNEDKHLLSKQLDENGIISQDICLDGRFHSQIHEDIATEFKKACRSNAYLRLPSVDRLCLPLRNTADTEIIKTGSLTDIALDVTLLKRADWFQTVNRAVEEHNRLKRRAHFVPIGRSTRVPPSLRKTHPASTPGYSLTLPKPAEEIAVVGMACRFPQADNLDEFWRLLESGSCSVSEIPSDRFNPSHVTRGPKISKYYGNFLREPAVFDHRFFGISGREAKSMDPQQRLVLQVAYEALESSGYYVRPGERREKDVGVYLGVGAVDYEANVSGEDAGAFSATGTLRAFISGRVSHFFGWSGPSITFDTACSSSSVAIHSACRALLANECAMAVAGGVNVITSPSLYQNLAAASFLNADGSSKAFDASANGYCRGEGSGLLVLKPLSRALADNDLVFGVIAGSAVNQGSNSSPITVPHSGSQSALYHKALKVAGIDPAEVTYVEGHGTGTQVGDPIEYESVRSALNSPRRIERLFLGSVKDNIGHTEAASGAAGLVKTLLMMQHQTIPKQANFRTLNPRISTPGEDMMAVPSKNHVWKSGSSGMLVALVNNYGAAGSNAVLVVREHVDTKQPDLKAGVRTRAPRSHPVFVAAKSHKSLLAHLTALQKYDVGDEYDSDRVPVSRVAQAVTMRGNPDFEHRAAFKIHDAESWSAALRDALALPPNAEPQRPRSVVLCFGGQTGRSSTVSKHLYEYCAPFRKHLEACAATCEELQLPSLLPSMLGKVSDNATEDMVGQHCRLFAQQYASAMAWLDSGLEVDTLVGHSFGQLTALCVAGSLSLRDAICFISGRARLMSDAWEGEPGGMLSLECEREDLEATVEHLNSEENIRLSIACYNGSRSFVVSGDSTSLARIEESMGPMVVNGGRDQNISPKAKMSRIGSSHAFHSHLTESILPRLKDVAHFIQICPPTIHIETCTEGGTWKDFGPNELVQHTRTPVFFHDAVQRIEARCPEGAIWLEAGSNSPVIAMTRRIIDTSRGHVLIPVNNLGDMEAMDSLANASCKLWMAGKGNHHWEFHGSRSRDHAAEARVTSAVPPYQFERTEHWIQYRAPESADRALPTTKLSPATEPALIKHFRREGTVDLFAVNTASQIFQLAARGHAVAGQSLCPASMYIELATRCYTALLETNELARRKPLLPHIQDLIMSAPLGLSQDSLVLVRIARSGRSGEDGMFTIVSQSSGGTETEHASGRASVLPQNDAGAKFRIDLLRRLARGPSRAEKILSSPPQGVSGDMVYRLFEQVVTYASYFRGVQNIASLRNESAGRVTLPAPDGYPALQDRGLCDPITVDNFLQVAGIHVNCLSERRDGRVFMCVAVEEIVLTPEFVDNLDLGSERSWVVHSRFDTVDDDNEKGAGNVINDIFVYDEVSHCLALGVMGATFKSVPFKSVSRSLARLNTPAGNLPDFTKVEVFSKNHSYVESGYHSLESNTPPKEQMSADITRPQSVDIEAAGQCGYHSQSQVLTNLRETVSTILEIPVEEILPTSKLEDLGIDSLLVTEVVTEIEKRFGTPLSKETILGLDTVLDLSRCILPAAEGNTEIEEVQNGKAAKTDGAPAVRQTFPPQSDNNEPLEPGPWKSETNSGNTSAMATFNITNAFSQVKDTYDNFATETGFAGFYGEVFPLQSELVVRYIVEAFASLGCGIGELEAGIRVPQVRNIAKHDKLMLRLYTILEKASLIIRKPGEHGFRRTSKSVPSTLSPVMYEELLWRFPQHASETKLLATTAPHLADCLTGNADAIDLLFGSAPARALLEDVYANAPMFLAGTRLLIKYLSQVIASAGNIKGRKEVRILELGAGTGGTTRYLLEAIVAHEADVDVVYTFTDLSGSLVAAAKRKFAMYADRPRFRMEFSVLDLEAETLPSSVLGKFDLVVSTNCVHATRDLAQSTGNIRSMLRSDYEGMLCLVELMPVNLYWFDLVFGLLEGWWRFEDGRDYALANERHWENVLKGVGFEWVDWTESPSNDSGVLKVITASVHGKLAKDRVEEAKFPEELVDKETVVFKKVDGLNLCADIYYPKQIVEAGRTLPIGEVEVPWPYLPVLVEMAPIFLFEKHAFKSLANQPHTITVLMIHGGGHIMLSRNDIRPEQTQWLLRDGFLPISIDYRLCPETTLAGGAMTDVADALSWARDTFPQARARLHRPDVIPDGGRVVAVGWSTGGMLALSLGWTKACRPPDAILAMYCPSDYEDPFWRRPNRPAGSDGNAAAEHDGYALDQAVRAACSGKPIVGYNVPPANGSPAAGGWLAPRDPRSRLALHMNWRGRTLDVLLGGVDALGADGTEAVDKLDADRGCLDIEAIRAISPLARVQKGDYAQIPTFLVHPSLDDLIPVAQAHRMYAALKERGIEAQLKIIQGQQHLFDVYPRWKADRAAYDGVAEGYEFLKRAVSFIP